jgi:membrane-associated phospholipid phosphatase
VNEARRSFPSGHASVSAVMAGFITLLCFKWALLHWNLEQKKLKNGQNEKTYVLSSG